MTEKIECDNKDKCFFMQSNPPREDLCKECLSNENCDNPKEDYYTVFQRNGY